MYNRYNVNNKVRSYYIPKYKYELVELLSRVYKDDRKKFKRMSKKRLYAIWFSVNEMR